MKHVLHDRDNDTCVRILQVCWHAMATKARLLVCQRVIPPGNDAVDAKVMDVHMLVKTQGGRERTEIEYVELLTRARFELLRTVSTESPWSVMEARPVLSKPFRAYDSGSS